MTAARRVMPRSSSLTTPAIWRASMSSSMSASATDGNIAQAAANCPEVFASSIASSRLTAALARSLFLAGLAVVVVGCGIGWVLAGRSLRPIDRIAADAEGIAAGDFDRKIDVEDTESELGRLAVVLNDTFGRMNAAREHMAQFTADASHELRTPLTVILSDSQGALRQERTPAEYRATLEGIRLSALRMKSISDALLELAQGDAGKPECGLSQLGGSLGQMAGKMLGC